MSELKNAKYIVSELKKQELVSGYATFATRILYMDDKIVPGAFQMNCSWYLRPPATQKSTPHTHECDEIIGFFGSNPDDPHDLGGEVEFWLEEEKYILTRTSMIFVPKGMQHCPLRVRRVDRPLFHFTVLNAGEYRGRLLDGSIKPM
jgi:hypothetical protein